MALKVRQDCTSCKFNSCRKSGVEAEIAKRCLFPLFIFGHVPRLASAGSAMGGHRVLCCNLFWVREDTKPKQDFRFAPSCGHGIYIPCSVHGGGKQSVPDVKSRQRKLIFIEIGWFRLLWNYSDPSVPPLARQLPETSSEQAPSMGSSFLLIRFSICPVLRQKDTARFFFFTLDSDESKG